MPFCANPSRPTYKPPPGAVDAHCHVFGPADVFPYAPERKYTPCDAPKEKLFALRGFLGFSRNVIVQATCHGADNRALIDALKASDGLARGIATVRPSVTADELKALDEAGVRGVRFNFVKHLGGMPDMGEFHRIIGRIRPLGWHVDLHFDASDLVEHADLLRDMPVPFLIDHMGRVPTRAGLQQEPFRRLLDLLKNNERCWVKVSGSERISTDGPPFTDAVPFARALIEAAPDRILWGTDWPHPNIARHMPNDGDLVDLIPLFAPEPQLQQKILVDNPHRLYEFTN